MYPSTISALTNPLATDRLNNPSHSSIESAQNDNIEAIQTFVGTTNASAIGTLIYDIRSPSSDGGGHIQTANKGGTGQDSYSKGDVLVATSSSVLTKLSAGTDNQVLTVNSSTASGINWANSSTNKVSASVLTSTVGQNTVSEVSVFSVAIPGSTLGINNVIRATVYFDQYGTVDHDTSIMVRANYGSNTVASMVVQGMDTPGDTRGLKGSFVYTLYGNGSSGMQSANVLLQAGRVLAKSSSVLSNYEFGFGTSSVNSSAQNNIGLTHKFSTADTSNGIRIQGITVEKLV